jgi:AAA+ superfamily predicted ATPase
MPTIDPAMLQSLNDAYLSASNAWIRAILESNVALANQRLPTGGNLQSPQHPTTGTQVAVQAAEEAMRGILKEFSDNQSLPLLLSLSDRLDLSPFEFQVLQLCLAFELDPSVGPLCGLHPTSPQRPYPTFALAMVALRNAHWDAVSENGNLRRYQLVHARFDRGTPLVARELELDETILHFARGIPALSPAVRASLAPVSEERSSSPLNESFLRHWRDAINSDSDRLVVVQLIGNLQEAVGTTLQLSEVLNRTLSQVKLGSIPQSADDLATLSKLWARDCRLFEMMFFISDEDSDSGFELGKLRRFLQSISDCPCVICVATPEKLDLQIGNAFLIELPPTDFKSQRRMWMDLLPSELDRRGSIAGELSQQFILRPSAARQIIDSVDTDAPDYSHLIRRQCLLVSRPKLQGLAQRIDCRATWSDLVLPDDAQRLLSQVVDHVNYRYQVYDDWKLADQMNRGLGISVLFAGESGTGKTMAAEVIANTLDLDLYRVDLSSVINKYIGETEKHLRKLFDAFETCGSVLFFDECDALFGKRSDVKDSHDRYANIEINYLLQRLEAYQGVAILATNKRSAIDSAFLRRLRFVINFPMPEPAVRESIWRRHLQGQQTDISNATPGLSPKNRLPIGTIDFVRLAQFPLTGGNIQSIVINAAFRSAVRGPASVIEMSDLLAAIRDEYVKLDRPFNESLFGVEAIIDSRTRGRVVV